MAAVGLVIQHFVITRFNLRTAYSGTDRHGKPVLGPSWMHERIELFERYCLPSMVHQVNQNFTWLVLLDEATDPESAARVERHQADFPAMRTLRLPPIQDDREIGECVTALVDDRTELLLTTRLDNDDAFHERATETIQASARKKREFLNFRVGWTQDGTTAWVRFHKYSHFITLAEPRTQEPFLTVHNGLAHGRSKRLAPVRQISREPFWLETVHGRNVTNRPPDEPRSYDRRTLRGIQRWFRHEVVRRARMQFRPRWYREPHPLADVAAPFHIRPALPKEAS
jgi:hypothetical protein